MVYKRSYRPRRRLRKRGFGLDVKLGKSVPFIGGSSVRLGTRSAKRLVRREINNMSETKQFVWDYQASALLQNNIYTSAPISYLPQSDDENGRTGRSIFLRHLRLQGVYFASADAMLRVIVYWSERSPTLAAGPKPSLTDANIGSTDLFHPSGNTLVRSLYNNKLGNKVICDRLYHVRTDSTTIQSNNWALDCPINSKIQYLNASIPSLLSDKQLYCSVIAYQPGITNASPTTVGILLNGIMTYKDL